MEWFPLECRSCWIWSCSPSSLIVVASLRGRAPLLQFPQSFSAQLYVQGPPKNCTCCSCSRLCFFRPPLPDGGVSMGRTCGWGAIYTYHTLRGIPAITSHFEFFLAHIFPMGKGSENYALWIRGWLTPNNIYGNYLHQRRQDEKLRGLPKNFPGTRVLANFCGDNMGGGFLPLSSPPVLSSSPSLPSLRVEGFSTGLTYAYGSSCTFHSF